jgi:PAS domain-containing protein
MELSSPRPIELILARNLLSSLSTPAFLASGPGEIIFYNDAAARILGQRFEETAPSLRVASRFRSSSRP